MKKNLFLFGTLCLLGLYSTAQQKKPAPNGAGKTNQPTGAPLLRNALDSLSYAIGVLDGNFFKSQGVDSCNPHIVAAGFNDAINNKLLLSAQEADQLIRAELHRIARARIQPTIDEGAKFLEKNRNKPGVVQTASGLQYEIITNGTGEKPAGTDKVRVHYEGFLLNGQKFDSSRDRGEPLEIGLDSVIPAWTEGVSLMSVGSRYKFYVPYQLGYGEQGNGRVIPGGSTLIFDVELLGIVK